MRRSPTSTYQVAFILISLGPLALSSVITMSPTQSLGAEVLDVRSVQDVMYTATAAMANSWPYATAQTDADADSVTASSNAVADTTDILDASSDVASTSNSPSPMVTPAPVPLSLSLASGISMSGTMIYITALPPVSSSVSVTQTKHVPKPFNIAYLAPLFAVIGVAVGSLAAWVFYRCWMTPERRRARFLARNVSLEPGPPYTSYHAPESQTDNTRSSTSLETRPLRGGIESNVISSEKSPGGPGNGVPTGSWLLRAISARRPGWVFPARSNPTYGPDDSGCAEDDPFIDAQTHPASRVRDASRLSSIIVSPSYVGDECNQEVEVYPHDFPHDDSIHRGVLERLTLRLVPSNVVNHPIEGDVEKAENRLPPKQRPAASRWTARSHHGYRQTHKQEDSDVRIEDLKEYQAARSSTSTSSPTKLPLSSSARQIPTTSARNDVAEDKFTAVPVRRHATEKRSNNSPRVVLAAVPEPSTQVTMPAAAEKVHASILSDSPPPPTEAQLFFGPILDKFGDGPALDLHIPDMPLHDEYNKLPHVSSVAISTPKTSRKTPKTRLKSRGQKHTVLLSLSSPSHRRERLLKHGIQALHLQLSTDSDDDRDDEDEDGDVPPSPSPSPSRCQAAADKADQLISRALQGRNANVTTSSAGYGTVELVRFGSENKSENTNTKTMLGVEQPLDLIKST